MADQASLVLSIGWWTDEENNSPSEKVITVRFDGIGEPDRSEIIKTIGSAHVTPWSYEYTYSSYFANASADSIAIAVVAAPMLAEAILAGTAEVFFEHVATKLLSMFKDTGRRLTMENAQQGAEHVLLYQAGIAKPDLRQLLARHQDDGSFLFRYRDERTGDDHVVVFGLSGAVAHANLTALSVSLDRLNQRAQKRVKST
jgi:hypothetical protein